MENNQNRPSQGQPSQGPSKHGQGQSGQDKHSHGQSGQGNKTSYGQNNPSQGRSENR